MASPSFHPGQCIGGTQPRRPPSAEPPGNQAAREGQRHGERDRSQRDLRVEVDGDRAGRVRGQPPEPASAASAAPKPPPPPGGPPPAKARAPPGVPVPVVRPAVAVSGGASRDTSAAPAKPSTI